MAVMGLRLAGRSNGVAALHGEVSREMFADLWPDVPADEVPIASVTNGVHAPTWVSPEMADVLSRHVLPEWHEAGAERWARARRRVPTTSSGGRGSRVASGSSRSCRRGCAGSSSAARPVASPTSTWTDEVLDPKALTICFARRFATYKRATLLPLPARAPEGAAPVRRPAGAVRVRRQGPPGRRRGQGADPPDRRLRRRPRGPPPLRVPRGLRHRRRPRPVPGRRRVAEQPAAPAGGLRHVRHEGGAQRRAQLLDPRRLVGRVLRRRERLGHHRRPRQLDDLERRDEIEADSLFELLERQIVPLFYERWQGPVPRRLGRDGEAHRSSRSARRSPPPAWCATTPSSSTSRPRPRATRLGRRRPRAAPGRWRRGRRGSSERGTACTSTASTSTSAVVDLGADRTVEAVRRARRPHARRRRGAAPARPGRPERRAARPDVGAADRRRARPTTATSATPAPSRCDQAGRYGVTVRVVPQHEPGHPGRAGPHGLRLTAQSQCSGVVDADVALVAPVADVSDIFQFCCCIRVPDRLSSNTCSG